jgi:hypothetical protein
MALVARRQETLSPRHLIDITILTENRRRDSIQRMVVLSGDRLGDRPLRRPVGCIP